MPLVVMHGAASCPQVARGAFAPVPARSFWLAGHGPRPVATLGDGAADRAALDAAVRRLRPETVAGISYGAHQVARWAATAGAAALRDLGVRRLALLLPAWTGRPTAVAAATAAQAEEFDRVGIPAALSRIQRSWPGWVADTLADSWPRHDPARIGGALRAVAASRGPEPAELAMLDLPVTVVAVPGDPLHPAAVAARWAELLPAGRLVTTRAACLADLGAAALSGFR